MLRRCGGGFGHARHGAARWWRWRLARPLDDTADNATHPLRIPCGPRTHCRV